MKDHRSALTSPSFQLGDDVVTGVAIQWSLDFARPAEGANLVNGILV